MTAFRRLSRLMIGAGRKAEAGIQRVRATPTDARDETPPASLNPRWDEFLRVTEARLRPARSAFAEQLLGDPVLAAMLPAARALLGDRHRATLLFGSRARQQARADSDYDLLFLVNIEDTRPLYETLKPVCPPPISFGLCGFREAWDALLHDGDIALLNMLTEGVVLDGDVPWLLREAVALTIELFRLRPAPAISKGAWVAGWDLPPRLPLLWQESGALLSPRPAEGFAATAEDEGIDHLLRALVAVRVRGDLALPRSRLLELVEEHVLAKGEAREVRSRLDDRLRLAEAVREILSARYRDWEEEVLWRLETGSDARAVSRRAAP